MPCDGRFEPRTVGDGNEPIFTVDGCGFCRMPRELAWFADSLKPHRVSLNWPIHLAANGVRTVEHDRGLFGHICLVHGMSMVSAAVWAIGVLVER